MCGYIGCGRYNAKHAVKHFEVLKHSFSMELDSQRIWSYKGDNYVHRLIKTRKDTPKEETKNSSPSQKMTVMNLPDG